jgi:hypothetical protein
MGKHGPGILRTVRLEHVAQEELDAACDKYPRMAEAWRGVEWRLSHRPEEGMLLDFDGEVYLHKIDPPVSSAPLVTTLYQYDHETVSVLSIKVTLRE